MKIGFIGFGKSANLYHLPFISTIDKLEVMGYFVPFKSNNSYNYQIKRYKSTVELYKNCDLVVITTPPFFHFEYAKEAILNNKNVLVEKPFCFTVEEAKFLFELAKNTPSAANIAAYATIVRERSMLRQLISAANEINDNPHINKT